MTAPTPAPEPTPPAIPAVLPVPVPPNPSGTYPIAPKVKWGALGSYVLGAVGLAIFGAVTSTDIISTLPDWATALILPLIPTIGSFVSGYAAKHQYRADEVTPSAPPG